MGERLKEKVALVSGAGSIGPGWSNGKAAAVAFAREGARVFAVDIREEAAAETHEIIRSEGGESTAHAVDVSDSTGVREMVTACLETYGRIDVLHNNVGIVEVGGPEELAEDAWEHLMKTNVTSMYLTCKRILPHMVAQGGGAIVNLSSIVANHALGYPCASYAASKGAVAAFTRNVALQYANRGIRCNAILPGLMNTPLIYQSSIDAYDSAEEMVRQRNAICPMGYMGDAWDVAHAAVFLASDEAKYITGIELVVDGGITLKVG